ncbi:MAG: ABC transporter substrate-binding protein [Dehalococcoidia bacterium]|nr:ABC transporter substrate-binding protein [Dehalococcoidia bacterium]
MDNYWTRKAKLSRRTVLVSGATTAVGVAAFALGCGDDDDDDAPAATGTATQGANTPASGGGGGDSEPTGQLAIAIAGLPPTLDPHRTSGGGYFPYNWEPFEGLLSRGDDGAIIPGLAESYEYSDDLTQLTLKLRSDVTFHNGDPFTSEDVAFSLERLRTPDFKMAYAPNFARIENVDTPDAQTVTFRSGEPFPELHQYLDSYFYVVPKKYLSAPGGEENFGTTPVGTGPYKVTRFATDSVIEFEAYEGYWGTKAKTQKVALRALPEASTRIASLQSGEVDLIWDLAPQFFEQVRSNSDFELVFSPAVRVRFIMLNLRGQGNAAYKDPRVREALNLAINREQIANVVFGGAARPGGWFAPKGIVGHKEAEPYAHDPDRAKELLAEAGFPDGLEIDPLAYASADPEAMYNGVLSDWGKVGIKSTNAPLGADFVDVLRSHTAPMIATQSQNVAYDGASDLIRWLRSDGGYSISDGSLDDDIDNAAGTGGDARATALQSVFERVYNEFLVIPIVETDNVYAYRTDRIKAWPQIQGWPYPRNYGRIEKA